MYELLESSQMPMSPMCGALLELLLEAACRAECSGREDERRPTCGAARVTERSKAGHRVSICL